MTARYFVEPIDNGGTLDPPPPRDRTWGIFDRDKVDPSGFPTCIAEYDSRRVARGEVVVLIDANLDKREAE